MHILCTGAEQASACLEVAAVEQPVVTHIVARTRSLDEVERIVACLEPLASAVDDGEELEAEALFERIQTLLAE